MSFTTRLRTHKVGCVGICGVMGGRMTRYFKMLVALVVALMAMVGGSQDARAQSEITLEQSLAYISAHSEGCSAPAFVHEIEQGIVEHTLRGHSQWRLHKKGYVEIEQRYDGKLFNNDGGIEYFDRRIVYRVYFHDLYVGITVSRGVCSDVTIHCRINQCIVRGSKVDDSKWAWDKADSARITVGGKGHETEHIERAIRHAIKIEGGKEDPFR